jgi:5-methylcytosine-specific restriction endonuclease McrA
MTKWHGSKWISPTRRLAIYIRDNYHCVYCNKDLKNVSPNERTLDHIVPVSKGGSNKSTNLITSCKKCNSSRRNISIYKFTNKETIRRIKRQRYRSINKYIIQAKKVISKL